jgi:uncharacterized repeat protein (TIGR02543 family)
MKKATTLLYILFFLVITNPVSGQNIVINEILASNTSLNTDEDGLHQDWIELYNNGSSSVNLLGYGLSDDTILNKWVFPNISIGAGQYLLIWASEKNRTVVGSPLHANFKISSAGEVITLSNSSGVIEDSVPATAIPTDISYGRSPNGTGPYVFFETPTPKAANTSTGYSGVLNPPVFSQNSGFYTASFDLTLSSTDSGTSIIYTLDGSEPDENNLNGTTYSYKNQYTELPGQETGSLLNKSFKTLQYNNPINIVSRSSQPNKISGISSTYDFDPSYYIPDNPVFKGTIVRVKVIKSGFIASKIITKNYFITSQGSSKFSIPVVSLSLNEDRFFDYEDGIYVAGIDFDDWRNANPDGLARRSRAGNYYRETDNERKANMCYLVNGIEVINQEVGLRIRGASTRRYEHKSLTVYARSEYGDKDLDYKFFSDLSYTSFERLTLSNSGSDFRNTMFRDALVHQLCKSLHGETEAYQPTVAFINGEFWGILNLRERFDDNYFKRVYNTNAVDMLKDEGVPKEGDAVHYNAMIDYVETHSLDNTSNFNYIKTQLDPESFSDNFISNIFFQNWDWPNNNVQYWRNRVDAYNATAPYGLDGRWRWVFHDMDDTFSIGTNDFNGNTLAIATSVNDSGSNPYWSTLLLRKLLENNTFKTDFINRFADLLNTSFLSSRIISKMNEMKAVIAPEMPREISRWGTPENMDSWQYFLDFQKDFANARPAFQRDHIRTQFGISSNINATLNVSDSDRGYIKMNTIEVKDGTPGITGNPYPWTGIYFHDIPLKLKAIAKPGFVFDHWSGASTSTNAEITITPTANFSVTAHFTSDGQAQAGVPIYFWMMDDAIPNNIPLESLNSTYEFGNNGVLQYESCLVGYPFTDASPNWRKASMERRNKPTSINYRPEANGNQAYDSNVMKGLQIRQPFQSGGLQNTMLFNFSTLGYKNIKFSFAAIDEGAASAIAVDYAVNSGAPVWITTGLAATSLPLTDAFQLFQINFSSEATVNNNANFKVRLRFTGSNMTVEDGKKVTFNNFAVDGVQLPNTFNISYTSPNDFTRNIPIANLNPTVSGGTAESYSVTPNLPTGLSLNTVTGVISGTPTVITPMNTYVVTATNSDGSTTADVVITVSSAAPRALSYNSPNVFTKNIPITNLNPSVSGGAVTSYSVTPNLPTGLSLNTTTGVISGTPTVITATATHVVTATNADGSTTADVQITVNDVAPNSLSYTTPNVFTKDTLIADLNPTVSGGGVISYNVSPGLPTGLSLNTSTGVISGTPTVISSSATYVVTAVNSGGSINADIVIKVNDIAPHSLSYSTPNVFVRNTRITDLNPTVSGGAVESYSISPNLPIGLSLRTTTGVISGIPFVLSATKTYLISAVNSGGSATFNIEITVSNTLSVNNPDFEHIQIFPNPFAGILNVAGVNPDVSYKIFTVDGKMIKKGMITGSRIELEELSNGLYFLQLSLDEKMEIKKIIKK